MRDKWILSSNLQRLDAIKPKVKRGFESIFMLCRAAILLTNLN